MRCPGQDRRYWTGEAAFEVPCPKCGVAVELFKDESSCRCRSCGCKVRNPRITFDCAQWCAFAEECLGFVPEREDPADPGRGALASRLIRAVKEEARADPARLGRALAAFQHARTLLAREHADPRIVLGAATLIGFFAEEHESEAPSAAVSEAERLLHAVDLDHEAIACVSRILAAYRLGEELDTMEFRVVRDACTLAKLPGGSIHGEHGT